MTRDGVYIAETGVAADELRSFVERIERLDEEIKAMNGDKKDVYAELKGRGFDTKAVKRIVQLRRQDDAERQEMNAIIQLYMTALDMA